MTIEQRVAVLEEIFAKLQDYYTSAYSGEEIDARLASAGVPIGITKEYKSVTEMNQDFTGTDVQRGQFVLILPDITASADYGKVYLKGTANWVPAFTLTTLTSIKGPIGPPGKKGDKGDPGEAGSSFAILGYFDTLADLKAAVPNPKAGGVYGVGTAPPYNIYIWDSVHGKWVPNGNLQGPQGKQGIQGPEGKQGPEGPVGGSSNFVRYDAAQSLTDGQKTQARDNIGAAPSGFGLGEERAHEVISDCNNAKLSGLYIMSSTTANSPPLIPNGQYSLLRVSARTSTEILQEVFCCGISGQYDFSAVRSYGNTGSWSPWEYINPPMQLGVEYRTTERYLGKPVYVKAVSCGSCPASGYKDVVYGNTGIVLPIRCEGTWSYSSRSTIPFESTDEDQLHIGALGGTIRVKTGGKDFSESTCTATVYYTKVTD